MMPSKPKKVRVLVKGRGRPPGYAWNVDLWPKADEDAEEILKPHQYKHLRLQVQELARQKDPTHSQTIDVRPVEDFYEIRDKGGPLGSLNIRLFYCVRKDRRVICILAVIHKQNDGPTPERVKERVRIRMRQYLNSEVAA